MIRKIKQIALSFSVASLLLVPALASGVGYASDNQLQQNICGGAEDLMISTGDSATGCGDASGAEDDVNNIITTVINIFSGVVGIVAVIMILFGGFKYITAGGDSSKIQSAQHTIIYAIVGLIIVALAQIIVRFVLGQATGSTA